MSNYSLVKRGTVTIDVGETSPVNVTLDPPVNLGSSIVNITFRESRFPDPVLDLDYRGVTARLTAEDNLRIEWQGTLATDPATTGSEQIVVSYEIFDLDDVGDAIDEALYRLQRLLQENVLQDLMRYDDAGNVVAYRLRTFDSRANVEDATVDLPDGDALEDGELSRITVTQQISISKNDRTSLLKVLTDLLALGG